MYLLFLRLFTEECHGDLYLREVWASKRGALQAPQMSDLQRVRQLRQAILRHHSTFSENSGADGWQSTRQTKKAGAFQAPAFLCPPSAFAPGPGAARPPVAFDKMDNLAGHVLAGGQFDAFEPRRGIDLHHYGAAPGLQNVHTRHVQANEAILWRLQSFFWASDKMGRQSPKQRLRLYFRPRLHYIGQNLPTCSKEISR